jgi:hypothetical protein
VNFTLLLIKDPNNQLIYDVPSEKVNIGFNHLFSKRYNFSVTIIGRWVKDFRVPKNTISNPNEFSLIYINMIYNFRNNLGLEFQATNTFNELYKLPKESIPDVPMSGRKFLVSLAFKFYL